MSGYITRGIGVEVPDGGTMPTHSLPLLGPVVFDCSNYIIKHLRFSIEQLYIYINSSPISDIICRSVMVGGKVSMGVQKGDRVIDLQVGIKFDLFVFNSQSIPPIFQRSVPFPYLLQW